MWCSIVSYRPREPKGPLAEPRRPRRRFPLPRGLVRVALLPPTWLLLAVAAFAVSWISSPPGGVFARVAWGAILVAVVVGLVFGDEKEIAAEEILFEASSAFHSRDEERAVVLARRIVAEFPETGAASDAAALLGFIETGRSPAVEI